MNKNKIVYNTQNICELIKDKQDVIYLDSNVILTPSAMDIVKSKEIKIVYKKDNDEASCNCCCGDSNDSNEIVKQTINILVNKCHITDEKIIKKVIIEVLKRVNL